MALPRIGGRAALVGLTFLPAALGMAGADPAHSAEVSSGEPRKWPCRIITHRPLLQVVEAGWNRSPTLRRQCTALAEKGAIAILRPGDSVLLKMVSWSDGSWFRSTARRSSTSPTSSSTSSSVRRDWICPVSPSEKGPRSGGLLTGSRRNVRSTRGVRWRARWKSAHGRPTDRRLGRQPLSGAAEPVGDGMLRWKASTSRAHSIAF
jgi:hypothetical protein